MINKIAQMEYENLRKNHNRLIHHVFGNDYYSVKTDVYTCDDISTDDLINRYDNLVGLVKFKTILIDILLIILVMITLYTTIF